MSASSPPARAADAVTSATPVDGASPRIAGVVDCGTNSVRLLVAARTAAGMRTLRREATVTRLGAGVDASGHFDDQALARTVDAVARYVVAARVEGAKAVRVIGTSAVRDAADRDRFVDAVREATGLDAEVVTGEAEAALAFAGAVGGVDGGGPALVLDIGGGSTELILGADAPVALASENLGCVRLTESSLPGDPPPPAAVAQAREIADERLRAAIGRLDRDAGVLRRQVHTIVAVAGTATTLAALHLGLAVYDPSQIHGTRLTAADVRDLTEALQRMPAAVIAAHGAPAGAERGPVAPGREDVLLAGALVLERAVAALGADTVLVSETDLLDGACRELLADAG